MKTTSIALILCYITLCGCGSTKKQAGQYQSKWISLFNKKDIKDWFVKIHHHGIDENFGNTFRVEDGMVKVRYDQ